MSVFTSASNFASAYFTPRPEQTMQVEGLEHAGGPASGMLAVPQDPSMEALLAQQARDPANKMRRVEGGTAGPASWRAGQGFKACEQHHSLFRRR